MEWHYFGAICICSAHVERPLTVTYGSAHRYGMTFAVSDCFRIPRNHERALYDVFGMESEVDETGLCLPDRHPGRLDRSRGSGGLYQLSLRTTTLRPVNHTNDPRCGQGGTEWSICRITQTGGRGSAPAGHCRVIRLV